MADEVPVQAPVASVAPGPDTKKPWLSKTLILNFIVAVTSLAVPPVAKWIGAHPEAVMSVFAAINFVLRLLSSDKISLQD